MGKIVIKESVLRNIISECVRSILTENELKPGTYWSVPRSLSNKYITMLAKKYDKAADDFEYDGVKIVYEPKRRPRKAYAPKRNLSKPDTMSVEQYEKDVVIPNNEKYREKISEYADEEWREVKNPKRYFGGNASFKDYHEISNYGRLKTLNLSNPLRSYITDGYDAPTRGAVQGHLTGVDNEGNIVKTTPPITSMVADAFLDNFDPRLYKVVHIDGDYRNNYVGNLKLVPRKGGKI